MNIDTLITQLESAAELATDGEWHAHLSFLDVWDEDGIVASTPAQAVTDEEAQAIAIRHNTATQVLSELKTQRARADRAEARVKHIIDASNDLPFPSDDPIATAVNRMALRIKEPIPPEATP